MKRFLSLIALLTLTSLARGAAPVVTNIANFPSVSVAYTNYVSELITTNGVTIGGVRKVAWPAGTSDNWMADGATNSTLAGVASVNSVTATNKLTLGVTNGFSANLMEFLLASDAPAFADVMIKDPPYTGWSDGVVRSIAEFTADSPDDYSPGCFYGLASAAPGPGNRLKLVRAADYDVITSSDGIIDELCGVFIFTDLPYGTIDTQEGIKILLSEPYNDATLNYAYGLNIRISHGAGSIRTAAVYADSNLTGTDYFLYSEGGRNYLAGSLGVGTPTPTEAIDAVGTIKASTGFGSLSVGTVTTSATGATNTLGANVVLYVTAATGASLTDNAGTTEFSGVTIAGFTPIRLQPGGKFIGTSITYATGTASHAW